MGSKLFRISLALLAIAIPVAHALGEKPSFAPPTPPSPKTDTAVTASPVATTNAVATPVRPLTAKELLAQADKVGDDREALRLVRQACELDPTHDSAYEQLWELATKVKLPENQVEQGVLMAGFPKFRLHVSQHFLIVYDTEDSFARERGSMLEEAHDTFYRRFRAAGLRPMPLEERLVCVLFNDHEDFVRYADRVDQMNVPWASGYYSSRTNRIAFFHDRDNPQFKPINDRIAELDQQLDQLLAAIDVAKRAGDQSTLRDLGAERNKIVHDRNWHRNRLAAVADMTNRGKTTHECVHQLCFNSGLMSRHVAYPFWAAEGLATSFESTKGGKAFGPGIKNPSRFNALIEAFQNDRLIPLHDFVATVQPSSDDQAVVSAYYAQSWGLFNYLFTRQQEGMRKYLTATAQTPPGELDAETLRKQFEDAFGPIENIQTLFTAYVRTLR
ncbi:MAG: DUF1570 domain-containing protein [Phycisphaera sp.]|nr:DUF1570 domain-containing protein [Phycisphaera sp.]